MQPPRALFWDISPTTKTNGKARSPSPQFLDLVQGVFWTLENIFPSSDPSVVHKPPNFEIQLILDRDICLGETLAPFSRHTCPLGLGCYLGSFSLSLWWGGKSRTKVTQSRTKSIVGVSCGVVCVGRRGGGIEPLRPPPPPNLGFVGLCLCLSASLPVSLKWREGVWEHLTMRVEGIARGRRPGVSPWAR